MRRPAAKRRQNAGGEREPCDVFGRGLRANENDWIADLCELGCSGAVESGAPARYAGRGAVSPREGLSVIAEAGDGCRFQIDIFDPKSGS